MLNRSSAAFAASMALLAGTGLTGCIDAEADVGESQVSARRTQETVHSSLATGLVGLAHAQVAQLNLTMLHPPEPVIPPEPVHLLVSLVGEDGALVARRNVALVPGQSATLRAPGPAGGRTLVRAAISIDPAGGVPPDDGLASGGILAVLEIVDAETGSSHVVVNPLVIKGFNPQPEPPALMQ